MDTMTYWQYERLDAEGKKQIAYRETNDLEGKYTGRPDIGVYGVKAWLDENPEEARRLGWVKHIKHDVSKYVEYDPQTQYVLISVKIIDEHTIEDEYHVFDKTEEMLRKDEENLYGWEYADSIIIGNGGVFNAH